MKPYSIIDILDDECSMPGDSNDLSFMKNLLHFQQKHPHFVSVKSSESAQKKPFKPTVRIILNWILDDENIF